MKIYNVERLPPNKRMLPKDIAEHFGVSVATVRRMSSVKEKGKKLRFPMERHYLKHFPKKYYIWSNDVNRCFFEEM